MPKPFLVAAGAFLALCVAWMSVLPLFAGPDEPANFIKSSAVVRGHFVGEPIDASATTSFWSTYVDIDARFGTAQQVPWCFVGQPQTPACDKPLESLTPTEPSRTDMGRYPSLGFFPAGIGTLVGPTDAGARAARFSAAITAALLLAIGAELLRRRKKSIVPMLAAATPGVFFMSSVSSPSGFEVTAAVAAWVALWCAIEERWRVRATITAFVVAAALLIVARPAGVVTVCVMFGAALVADHRALINATVTAWRHWLWLAAALLASGEWYMGVYDDNFGVRLDIETRVTKLSTIASRSLADLPRKIHESIGNFGWLDTPSPTFVAWSFVAIGATLCWRAFATAHTRVRVAIALVVLAVPIWHIALNRNYQGLLGTYGAQGRHLTPFLVGVPLAAVMKRVAASTDKPVISVFVGLHLWCVLVALRRYSVGTAGDDLLGFIDTPAWSPPLGMTATLAIVAIAHVAAWFGLRVFAGRMER